MVAEGRSGGRPAISKTLASAEAEPNLGSVKVDLTLSSNCAHEPFGNRRWPVLKAAVFLLLAGVVSLSVAAKNSRYVSASGPVRYLSKASKMREGSPQQVENRDLRALESADVFPAAVHRRERFFSPSDPARPKLAAAYRLLQPRSPPPFLA